MIVVIRISAYLQLHQATLSLAEEGGKESCVQKVSDYVYI